MTASGSSNGANGRPDWHADGTPHAETADLRARPSVAEASVAEAWHGHSSVEEALRRLRRGEMVLVSDGADREDEADLTMAAEWVSPEALAFMLRHGRGLVCMPCDGRRLERLGIGAMVTDARSSGGMGPVCDTAFTVSIDHKAVGSGISVADRAATIRAVLDPWSRPEDFIRPGHVFPLRAREGGVLVRPGHTEAAVDLARLAGLAPCAVICEVLNDDGAIARGPELAGLAAAHDLAWVTIEDLVAYRRWVRRPALLS